MGVEQQQGTWAQPSLFDGDVGSVRFGGDGPAGTHSLDIGGNLAVADTPLLQRL
jgi:hypothetical protein